MGKKLTKLPKIKYCKIYYDRHGGLRIYVRSQGKTHPEQMLNKIGTPEFEIEKGQKLQQLNQPNLWDLKVMHQRLRKERSCA